MTMKINSVKAPMEFVVEVEQICEDKSVGYLEALMIYAEVNSMEFEVIGSLVRQNEEFLDRLTNECEKIHLLAVE